MTDDPAPLTLAHLNIDVADLDRSERFYRDVLALPVTRRSGTLQIAWPGGLLVLAAGEPHVRGSFHFGFAVAGDTAVDAYFARFREHGVAIVAAPEDKGSVYVGRISDPDGYPIEIYAARGAASA